MAADGLQDKQAYLASPVARRAASPPPSDSECIAVLRAAVIACGLGAHSRVRLSSSQALGSGSGDAAMLGADQGEICLVLAAA